MALAFSSTIRTAQADAITTAAGNAALLRIYNGSRPASGGAATTLLAELVCGTPFAAGAAAGVLTLGAITQDSSADATAPRDAPKRHPTRIIPRRPYAGHLNVTASGATATFTAIFDITQLEDEELLLDLI